MSIIITGLNMPTERESFNLTIKYNGTVLDTETGMQVAEAHELPAHGDLIDRREAIIDANERAYDFWLSDDEVNATIQFLKEQPTIIQSSGGKEDE